MYKRQTLDSAFDNATDALAEATRRVNLFGPLRTTFEIKVPLTPGLLVGQTIRLEYPRFSLSSGKNFVLLTLDPDSNEDTHTLILWG